MPYKFLDPIDPEKPIDPQFPPPSCWRTVECPSDVCCGKVSTDQLLCRAWELDELRRIIRKNAASAA